MIKRFFTAIFSAISSFFSTLFGTFTWSTPPWCAYLKNKAVTKPRESLLIFVTVILVLTGSAYAYHWYRHRPQPELITAQIITPKITPLGDYLTPDSLIINFGVMKHNELLPRSVAPIALNGQEVTKDFTMTPAMAGYWQWNSDSQLVFTPNVDWPAGQQYTITFAPPFFSKNAHMESMSYTFTTKPFAAEIKNYKLYIDPANPRIRQAVADIHFNYPVDAATLENKINLHWQAENSMDFGASSAPLKYSIKLDEHKRIAYVKSESLPIPEMDRFLSLTVDKGVKPLNGPGHTEEAVSGKIRVADATDYFKVAKLASSIIRNDKDRPEQVLTVETTLGVKQEELDKYLQVYELPQDYPATMGEAAKVNYRWSVPGEVTPQILALAKPVHLTAIPADRDYATLHSYQYQVKTPAYLYVKLDKGAKAMGEFALAEPYVTVLPAPAFPREISYLHKGAVLALGTEEKLSVLVRGLPGVKFTVARVLPDDINHLVTQTSGDFNNPYFTNYSFNQDNISEIYSEVQPFDNSDPAKQQYTALDLGKYMHTARNNPGGALGLFLLSAEGFDPATKMNLGVTSNRLILITDLGLIAKDNFDGSHDIFVASITSGKPVAGVSVSVLGKNGLPVLTRTTDTQGRANFPKLYDFTNEREPTAYVAKYQKDISFMPYNRSDRQLNFSRFDIGGVTIYDSAQSALTAYVFSDRGIYRPGDEAHIAMIIKQPFVVPQAAGLPLEASISDPRGTVVRTERFTLNETGFYTFDFKTNPTSISGQYQVNLYIVKDNHASSLIGSTSLNVNEFLPDRLKITAEIAGGKTKGWVNPTDLTEKVNLWNLYGAPAVNHRISAKIILSPQAIRFNEYPDYVFLDPLLNPKLPPKVFTDTLPETKTDASGEATLNLKLDRFEHATYQLTIFSEGYEAEGGRSVTTRQSVLVSPLAYLVGYKTDGSLEYIKKDSHRNVHFIALNPALTEISLQDLKLHFYSVQPVTTLVKNENDTYEYKSMTQTREISSAPFAIAATGADYTLPANDIGDYLLTVTDKNETELARLKFSIVGDSQQPLPKNAELNVKLSKAEFNAGDEIEMQITSPYTGSGLITIERDKVYASQWFTTASTSSVQKIRIPADFKGNGYVNIAFMRDMNSPEIFMSPLSYSVQPFAVSHAAEAMKLDLNVPSVAKPGTLLTISYQSDKPGKAIVFAVDEGILQVARYTTPDPLQFFFQKRSLDVLTYQIVDQILPKYMVDREMSAAGGDEGEALLRQNINPFKRRTEAPVVFWSGIVDVDTSPRQLTYQIPNYFNGALRVMAVAAGVDAVGATAKTTEVRGDFIIGPNVPTFVAPGDEFVVTASVANNLEKSGADAEVTVELVIPPELTLLTDRQIKQVIPEGQERSVHFKLRANNKLGSAELGFTAGLNGKLSKMTSTVSVRPAAAYINSIASGVSQDKSNSVALNHEFYPQYRYVSAAISSSPLILVTGLQRYLDDYPYGCLEQLVSKGMPWLVMANQQWFVKDMASLQEKVNKTIQLVSQRQQSNGGFSYWPEVGSAQNDAFSSVYAMHFLLEAKLQGYTMPNGVYAAGINYLKELAATEVTTLDQARLTAYAIYILTRNEMVTTNYLTNLQLTLNKQKSIAWKEDITSAYLAATYQLLKSDNEAEKLIQYYHPGSKQADTNDFYNQNIADAQYLYLIAMHFPEKLTALNETLLKSLVAALNDNNMSTVMSGYTTLALSAYNHHMQPAAATSLLSIGAVGANGQESVLMMSNVPYQQVMIGAGTRQINFKNPDKMTYFYQVTQAGFNTRLPTSASSHGIEVYRDYAHLNNSPATDAMLGEEIIVHIRARSTDNLYHHNVALVDLLPGGFEVIPSSVTLGNMEYDDVREDRVIYFGSIGPESTELTYHMKATNVGEYTVPPMFGKSMYDPAIQSQGMAGKMSVK